MKLNHSRLLLAVIAALVILAAPRISDSAAHAALPGGAVRGQTIGGMTEYHFKNGLTALIAPDYSTPSVTVNVTYSFGSDFEQDGMRGSAHLMEHLLFAGTKKHPNIMQEISASGGNANGGTSNQFTTYYITFPYSQKTLEWAMSLESERMTAATFKPEDLTRERSVVLNEMKMGRNNPMSVLVTRMRSTGFDWDSSGHSVIGNPEDLRTVTYEQIRQFYKDHMRPELATVVVAGPVDEQTALAAVAKYFASIPRPASPVPTLASREEPRDGERSVTLRGAGDFRIKASMYQAPAASHKDAIALELAARILGAEPYGRLYKRLVQTKIAGSVNTFFWGSRTQSTFWAIAQTQLGTPADKAQPIIIDTVQGLAKEPPSKEELSRAKNSFTKDMDMNFADTESFANGMTEWVSLGDWRMFFYYRDMAEKVTPKDISDAAARYFVPQNRTLGAFEPSKEPATAIPAAPAPAKLFADFKPETKYILAEHNDSTPAALEKITRITKHDGIQAAFMERSSRGGLVTVRINLNFGDLPNLHGKGTIAEITGSLLDYGTKTRTRDQVRETADRLGASIRTGGSATSAWAAVTAPEENLTEALSLAVECLRSPRMDASQLEVLKNEIVSSIKQAQSDPGSVAANRMNQIFSPYTTGDIRTTTDFAKKIEQIQKVTPKQAADFHSRFYSAAHAQVSVVGSFNQTAIEPVISKLLSGWQTKTTYTRVTSPFIDIQPAKELISIPGRPNATMLASAPVKISTSAPDYADAQVAAMIMGGGFLDSRLYNRIRAKESTSYHVSMKLDVPSTDDFGRWLFKAIMAPADTNRVEQAFYEEMDIALTKGFTAAETERAKVNLTESLKMALGDNSALASEATRNLYLGRSWQWYTDLEARISKVTPESAHTALKKYLHPKSFTVVIAGDI